MKTLKQEIITHPGMQALQQFGENLKAKPLDNDTMKVFMASLWEFFRETPLGILSLSLRLGDFWMAHDPWKATAKAAHILCADVDEFGLHDMRNSFSPTHHELFQITAQHFNITTADLLNKGNIIGAALQTSKAFIQYYRHEPLPVALGFHLASELTSWPEFKNLLAGMLAHKQVYRVTSERDKAMTLFWVHTLVEPMHLDNSEKIILDYCQIDTNAMQQVRTGALAYMDCYEELFTALDVMVKA